MTQPNWKTLSTEEKIATIEPHRVAGASAAVLSQLFANCTRNAVIGFMTRQKIALLGNSGQRATPLKKPPRPPAPARLALLRPAPVFTERPLLPVSVIIDPPKGRKLSLMELKSSSCRWPEGDPRDPDFGFCGDIAVEGRRYCLLHWKRGTLSAAG